MPKGFKIVGSTPPQQPHVAAGKVELDDFWAFPPSHQYIYMPCREAWPAESINAILPPVVLHDAKGQPQKVNGKIVKLKASLWLDRYQRVEQLTWAPGLPEIVADKHVVDGGWFERIGGHVLNLYRPPRLKRGDASQARPWVDHVHRIYDEHDSQHTINWLAHRVQRPGEKINHALVLGGPQGIGKDTLLEPVKCAIGAWNFHEILPTHLLETFNPFVRSVILRVNEAHDLGEDTRINRFAFYDRCKSYTAAPPDVLRCNEKYLRQHYVMNVLGFLITTNHKSDGIYLPAEDRRHYVAWSNRCKEDFTPDYWNRIWHWYEREDGLAHVAAYLLQHNLSRFDPKAPPPQTAAFWDIVAANIAPEDQELADVIAALDDSDAFILPDLIASGTTIEWLLERKYRRALPHRLERCGYVPWRNLNADDGRWTICGKNHTIYVRAKLTPQERWTAAYRRRDRG
jgi:hypothetical protein